LKKSKRHWQVRLFNNGGKAIIKFLKRLISGKESLPTRIEEEPDLTPKSIKRNTRVKVTEKPYKEIKIPRDPVDRNLTGKELEKEGYVDNAIELYELNVKARFEGNSPYDRLTIIYRKRKQYDEEIRVLEQAISVFEALSKSSPRQDVNPKLDKFRERLKKVRSIANKE
jgi:tetratricopeptide (TPR) repeat protein